MAANFKIGNKGKPTATTIRFSQRSTCEALFFSFDQTDITKIVPLNITKDRSLSGNAQQASQGNLRTRKVLEVKSDIVKCTLNRNKGMSSGTFSMTLKRRNKQLSSENDYVKLVHPGDWVMLYMKKSGKVSLGKTDSKSGLKFLGIVESVQYVETDNPDKAAPELVYSISGRDFGKVFENELFFNPTVNNETIKTLLGVNFLADSKSSLRGDNRAIAAGFTPDSVVKNLVSFYLGGKFASLNANNQVWYVPQLLAQTFRPTEKIKSEVSFVDILNTDKIGLHNYDTNRRLTGVGSLPGATILKSLPATGTVWSVLQFVQNAALNEMYTELSQDANGNLQPTLVMRQMPFSNHVSHEVSPFAANARSVSDGGNKTAIIDNIASNQKTYFTQLPQLVINSSNIKRKAVGKNDHERVNHVIVTPKIDSEVYDFLYATLYNVPSVQRYGLRSLQTQTSYILDPKQGVSSYLERCTYLLADWFFLAHHLFNGTILISGVDEHVEVGSNVYISDIQQLYHIEGYTHSYEVLQDGRIIYETELRVSRGQVVTDSKQAGFIGPSIMNKEATTISSNILEGGVRG